MSGDCAGPLKKEKLMVISAPSARGKENCVPLICRLFRPSSELVFGPSRKFSQKIARIELVETGLRLFHTRRAKAIALALNVELMSMTPVQAKAADAVEEEATRLG